MGNAATSNMKFAWLSAGKLAVCCGKVLVNVTHAMLACWLYTVCTLAPLH